ncbi:DNA dependent ATPase [Scheffersomyces stipitis CBS 6054]|uniref:DNA dependent ATPase n=1 Tax=Scheffersomyces stipitis (strain ATCC 58785 / CBS 6054 / NBRC 10063 / NRRL Y-11545) TaxID=322104 RepID=A3LSJ3_PICST|nr:DNA dependent ATPase [Scheffersomyces stipitis CBS 6054]ABN65578.2 DNA dependent ATPase [Scheffersomyces stipitis CBS 6054]
MSEFNRDLEALGAKLVDQDSLETSITRRANEALLSKDAELDQKRLEKATKDLNSTLKRISILESRLNNPRTKLSERQKLRDEIKWFEQNELVPRRRDVEDITARLEESKKQLDGAQSAKEGNTLPGETEKEFLIRTGKITAFGNINSFQQIGQETEQVKSHVFLRAPGFEDTQTMKIEKRKEDFDMDNTDRDQDFQDTQEDLGEDSDEESSTTYLRNVDDGDELVYQQRLRQWVSRRASLRGTEVSDSSKQEWFKPHPTIPDAVLNNQFKLPGDIYPSLFDYQKTCVQWLWELYSQKTGGIIGDEMGLGKTIQVISFVAGLHYSGLLDKPVLVVVPATVLNQWVNEFHRWWPPLRCIILHSIGSGMGKSAVRSEEKLEEFLENSDPTQSKNSLRGINSQINAKEIVDRVMEKGHVLVTTYVGLRIYSKHILPREWGYVVLDEGHKIRNPDSDISLTCKQIKTYNRIILSGTPIQNNLIELWSLFDFVFPGRLGTLPVFQQQFSIPINMGGYANASNIQVQTGYKCAVILRDLISPYLLRRLKSDVAQDLPKKNEMVLFVKLTQVQQELYEKFLHSEELSSILKGRRNVLMGVDILRKICNHPDLVNRDILEHKKNYNYGNPVKSGKMQVLKNLLQLWQSQEHKTLLFCQTRQMLDILEKFVANLRLLDIDHEYFTYLRMDGSTPIAKRQDLVDKFNSDPNLHVFLLTTKVGGLGVNLTGADRVIIYDPDWNPSTDIQARERAWRLGQKKDITIYRLMTTGSIEEKIYHRQIFKTFLTNKILKDPKQRRFFKVNDLHDLFTLGDQNEVGTETGDMFNGSETNFGGNKTRAPSTLLKKKHKNDDDFYKVASITGVSKLDKFQGDEEEEEVSGESRDENRIMEGIFANSGVHSALKHDEIINSSNQEMSLVEKEASKVANEAASALKRSRKLARRNEIGTPTWTGKFGLAGRFGQKKKTVSGRINKSKSILGELKQKKAVRASVFTKKSNSSENNEAVDKKATIEKLVTFLQSRPDSFGTSSVILKNAGVAMKDENDMILIRSMLREIAVWDSGRSGWKLKKEFSQNEEL